ncbi:MAG TPA: trypsin-like peptidase domain-containing protein, partial [Jatrophihabitans sp.]|nr:trypsin-like peptidase domain-containing protein [Jatrophihabitans sp.]
MSQPYPGDPARTDGPPTATAGTRPAQPGPPPPPAGPPAAPPAAPPARPRLRLVILLSALVAAVVGAGIGVASYAALDHSTNGSSITITNQAAPTVSAGTGTVAAAAAGIGPSVVTINVVGQTSAGTGSGVIISSDGYILTNNHVVTLDGTAPASSDRITVTLADGSEQTASVTGTDPGDDLAVVKIGGQPAQPAATFAKSAALQVGQEVVAVGAPLGLSNTVT